MSPPWSVFRRLEGENVFDAPLADPRHAAVEPGRFVTALRRAGADGAPPSFRGGPLSSRDGDVRAALGELAADGTVDTEAAAEAWEAALRLPRWEGAPVWVHGDLLPGNLLARRGRLGAVIDFGGTGVGDPACDTMPAWTLLTAETRKVFREAADVDDATWGRGRGWALCFGLVALPYYRVTHPALAAVARRAIEEVLADHRGAA